MTPGRLKIWNEDAGAWQYTPGGSQPWDEHDLSGDSADWEDGDGGSGTWSSSDGVISQTNATADASLTLDSLPLPSLEYVVEAEVRVPSGQDSGTTAQAVICAGGPTILNTFGTDITGLQGEGVTLTAQGTGDGQTFNLDGWVDGQSSGSGFPTTITQDTWHRLRGSSNGIRISVWLDGVYKFSAEAASGGNLPAPGPPVISTDLGGIGAVGLIDFRNIKVWTRPLPA